jgi:acetyltransferase-like isoleucine patch superfamily enzyme
LQLYQQKAVGEPSLRVLVQYELITLLLGNLAGSLGYLLRRRFYRRLFKQLGSGVIIGKSVALRHPRRITVGKQVAIDDNVLLDASGAGEEGIRLNDGVIISRNCVIQGKSGPVTIGARADIGCNTVISSIAGVHLGESVLVAGNCYIGGGQYFADRLDVPMMDQGLYTKGPVVIGDDVWLGAGVTVLDGVQIGKGCIVGAGAVVTQSLPEYSIAIGVPAKVVKSRLGTGS